MSDNLSFLMMEHKRACDLRNVVANYANEMLAIDGLLSQGLVETARARIALVRNSNGEALGWRPDLGTHHRVRVDAVLEDHIFQDTNKT